MTEVVPRAELDAAVDALAQRLVPARPRRSAGPRSRPTCRCARCSTRISTRASPTNAFPIAAPTMRRRSGLRRAPQTRVHRQLFPIVGADLRRQTMAAFNRRHLLQYGAAAASSLACPGLARAQAAGRCASASSRPCRVRRNSSASYVKNGAEIAVDADQQGRWHPGAPGRARDPRRQGQSGSGAGRCARTAGQRHQPAHRRYLQRGGARARRRSCSRRTACSSPAAPAPRR